MTTPSLKAVNPELVKAAAEMAFPEYSWRSGNVQGAFVFGYKGKEMLTFDLFRNNSDAHVLMLALMDEKWDFTKSNKRFVATNRTLKYDLQKDESFPLLLLKCVSAMKSIEVYV